MFSERVSFCPWGVGVGRPPSRGRPPPEAESPSRGRTSPHEEEPPLEADPTPLPGIDI